MLCPSLPDLLRKTILTFCEGSVKFQRTLEVIGSIHICSDSEKIATFLLDEQVTRPAVGADGHASDSVSKVAANETFSPQDNNKANLENNNNNSNSNKNQSSNPGIMLPPKKSRKTLRPVRKINYRYMQSLESSDAESDNEYITLDQNGRDSNGLQPGKDYIATRPLGMLEKRMREYLDNTDSNASMSSEETYKQNQMVTKQESEAQTSPSGPPSYEVSSTRPDDVVSMDQTTNESPSLSPQDSTPKRESPSIQSPEASTEAPAQSQVKEEMDTDGKYQYDSAYARSYESALILSTLATAHSGSVFSMMDPKAFTSKPDQPYALFGSNNSNDPSQKALISNSTLFLPQQQQQPQEQMFAEDLRSRPYSSPEPAAVFGGRSPAGPQGQKEVVAEGSWDKPVLCKICGRALKSEKMLDIHMNTAHTHKTIYPCKQCGKVFYAASSLHSHKKRTHTSMEQKYKCPHCDRFYAFQSELLRHIDTAHMDLVSMNSSQVNIGSDVAAFWAAYREHPPMNVDTVAPPATLPPPPLQQQQPQQLAQQQHPLPQIQPPAQQPTPPQPQPPPQEPSKPQQPLIIPQHQNGLTTNQVPGSSSPFTLLPLNPSEDTKRRASPAEEVVKQEVVQNNHTNAILPAEETTTTAVSSAMGPRYKCNICGMLLKSKECLSLHINAKHTQKQAYPCNVCGKVFYAPSSRFCHIRRVHASTEQKFHCDYCDKIFTFHYELRNHLKLMHRNKLIQRADGNMSETELQGAEDSSDVQDLSNGTTSPTQEISVSKSSSDQG